MSPEWYTAPDRGCERFEDQIMHSVPQLIATILAVAALATANQQHLSRADLIGYAKQIGINRTPYEQALDRHTYRAVIERDMAVSQQRPVASERPGERAALSTSTDVCEQKIPTSLRRMLDAKYPGLRLPRLSDQEPDGTEYDKRTGGDGCLTIASGDFDGDRQTDIAVMLTNEHATVVRLVVALRRGPVWVLYQLPTWCETIGTCYVQTAKPALFIRTEALDTPLQSPDEVSRIKSRTESVLSGTLESTGIVYAYTVGKWHYVWVSN